LLILLQACRRLIGGDATNGLIERTAIKRCREA
jgi:hypothetical protein